MNPDHWFMKNENWFRVSLLMFIISMAAAIYEGDWLFAMLCIAGVVVMARILLNEMRYRAIKEMGK